MDNYICNYIWKVRDSFKILYLRKMYILFKKDWIPQQNVFGVLRGRFIYRRFVSANFSASKRCTEWLLVLRISSYKAQKTRGSSTVATAPVIPRILSAVRQTLRAHTRSYLSLLQYYHSVITLLYILYFHNDVKIMMFILWYK